MYFVVNFDPRGNVMYWFWIWWMRDDYCVIKVVTHFSSFILFMCFKKKLSILSPCWFVFLWKVVWNQHLVWMIDLQSLWLHWYCTQHCIWTFNTQFRFCLDQSGAPTVAVIQKDSQKCGTIPCLPIELYVWHTLLLCYMPPLPFITSHPEPSIQHFWSRPPLMTHLHMTTTLLLCCIAVPTCLWLICDKDNFNANSYNYIILMGHAIQF